MPRDYRNLVLLVGLTGVGKSTIVDALVSRRGDLQVLPNRREIADEVIIPHVQRREGREPSPVRDRLERFRLMAVYRQMHPGGMTHALARWLGEHPYRGPTYPLLFDNLRGVDEVRAALEAFPGARFLVLHASPQTRLARLVGRADPFDRTGSGAAGADGAGATGDLAARLRAIDGVRDVFDPDVLAAMTLDQHLDHEGLVAAAQIIVEEQRHYDSAAAAELLQAELPAAGLRIVDTESANPSDAVSLVLAWLDEQTPS